MNKNTFDYLRKLIEKHTKNFIKPKTCDHNLKWFVSRSTKKMRVECQKCDYRVTGLTPFSNWEWMTDKDHKPLCEAEY